MISADWYDLSVVGNILFGYYGAISGYALPKLEIGAGMAQAADHYIRSEKDADLDSPLPPTYLDTKDDSAAIRLGYELYLRTSGGEVTPAHFYALLRSSPLTADLARRDAPSELKPDPGGYPYYQPHILDNKAGPPRNDLGLFPMFDNYGQ